MCPSPHKVLGSTRKELSPICNFQILDLQLLLDGNSHLTTLKKKKKNSHLTTITGTFFLGMIQIQGVRAYHQLVRCESRLLRTIVFGAHPVQDAAFHLGLWAHRGEIHSRTKTWEWDGTFF